MAHSEQDARTKVCRAPGALAAMVAALEQREQEGRVHPQQVKPPIPEPRCIASDCMMWRWVDTARRIKDEGKFPLGPSRTLAMALAPDSDREDTPNRRGRCGLAGKIT